MLKHDRGRTAENATVLGKRGLQVLNTALHILHRLTLGDRAEHVRERRADVADLRIDGALSNLSDLLGQLARLIQPVLDQLRVR
ncbi:hypothetical protein [Streptomyces sp. NPDC059092]|uniref:hypothetical protein n=1 Tax=Streptomyces sp. NPDC059092 TaxID=3346725 RepID=UPI0036814CDF